MKIELVFVLDFALVFGAIPKDRFDPRIFIDCTKFTTTQATIKPTTPPTISGNAPKSEEFVKINAKLVCLK